MMNGRTRSAREALPNNAPVLQYQYVQIWEPCRTKPDPVRVHLLCPPHVCRRIPTEEQPESVLRILDYGKQE